VSNPNRIFARWWLLIPLLALGFFAVTTTLRVRRVEYVSQVGGAAASQGGAWRPRLIVPGHHNESFEWLGLTRQMFARGEWRVRHIDFENAPDGREVYSASPYRWWLGLVAGLRHAVSGSPLGPSLEWAALYADPILLLLLAASTAVFIAWRFGTLAAALVTTALATLFPFASSFLPGIPDDHGLSQAVALWSLLPLLAGVASAGDAARERRWFAAAGVAGGIGLWVNASLEAPLLAGVALGGLLAAGISRDRSLPWRAWSLSGAVTGLAAYAAEFFPSHLGGWELRAIHPLLGIAWLGGGELLARLEATLQGRRPWKGPRNLAEAALAAAALLSLPVAMRLTHSLGFLSADLPSGRLSLLPGGVSAASLWAWLLQNGFTPAVWATLLPLLVIVSAVAILVRRAFGAPERAAVAVALGPVVVALAFAFRQLSWWNGVDCALLALLAATAAALRGSARPRLVAHCSMAVAALLLVPGAFQLWPSMGAGGGDGLTGTEVVGLIERDMAGWLAQHVGPSGAVVLAPPNATAALHYYGDMRGLGTFGWENRDGLLGAIRIVSASTPEEAQELINRRGVTHIIIPQWDPYLDAYAKIGEGKLEGTFLERLHRWVLPAWLRPIPYLIPTIEGFEGQSVTVLEVVDEQDDAIAASRLAEYFVDMGQMDLAANAGQALRRFPADLGALLARSQVAVAQGDQEEFARDTEVLLRRIAGGADKNLPWDQRVGLSVVLAQAHHVDLARERLRQCLAEADEEKLRDLSTNLLYRLEVLRRALRLDFGNPRLGEIAVELLPSDLRARIEK
jgi:hypothetical protein